MENFTGGKAGYKDDEAVANSLDAIMKVIGSEPEKAGRYIKAMVILVLSLAGYIKNTVFNMQWLDTGDSI